MTAQMMDRLGVEKTVMLEGEVKARTKLSGR
jgi:hypothetical protein